MGADGGTIPRRVELVRTKKKPEKIERDMENITKWKMCALSQEPLKEPIAACPLGRLYNKETVIERLVEKTLSESEVAQHIKSLKDLKELNLTTNPAFDGFKIESGDEYRDYNVSQFICPVVGVEMNGNHRFCVIWSCGCVFSEKALKEVKSDVCHNCGRSFDMDCVIILNGNEEETTEYRQKLEEKRQTIKAAKKAKKNGVIGEKDSNAEDKASCSKTSTDAVKRKLPDTTNDLSKNKKSKPVEIQKDTTTSKVYKSLFTSSETGKKQPRAHWVTFNPQYY